MAQARLDPEDEGATIFLSAIHKTTQREFPENFNPHLHLCKHLKFRVKHISP
jgi:hypothetical protein